MKDYIFKKFIRNIISKYSFTNTSYNTEVDHFSQEQFQTSDLYGNTPHH